MKHVTTEMINHPDDDVLAHLEVCARCRSRVSTDADLGAVRGRILDEIAAVGVATSPALSARPRWWARPWAVAAVAAAAVIAVFVPLTWLGNQSDDNAASTSPTVTTAEAPVVELPTRPEPPRPEDVAPFTPTAAGAAEPFEMSFAVGDEAVGLLIWQNPTFYEGVRGNLTEDGAVYDYGMYRAGDNHGVADPDNSAFPGSPSMGGDLATGLPDDPDIPWDLLIERHSDEEMWSLVTGGRRIGSVAVEPTHPAAVRAWAAGDYRLEVTDDGIPVVVEGPVRERFEVESLDRRPIRAGEIGNNTDIPFEYAMFLAAQTTNEQRPVLAKGFVTFGDYRAAAEAAAECAGTEATFDEATGMFVFSGDTTDCAALHADDIAAVWRVASQWIGEDEHTQIYYLVQGESHVVEMFKTEEGPERALASGDGWAISISERGPGYCRRTSVEDSSYGEGCF
ncbi:MAG: hypothetical protein ABFR89_12320, partial [Actinomycetota bacterium]